MRNLEGEKPLMSSKVRLGGWDFILGVLGIHEGCEQEEE